MNRVNRFLTLQLLAFWQGGFLFYAAFVVPIGGEVLGNETLQGFITQRASIWLNLIGYACLAVLSIDSILCQPFRRTRLALAFLSLGLLITLSILHLQLDVLLDAHMQIVLEPKAFYALHACYLIISGIQWLLMLVAAWYALAAWRASDLQRSTS